MKWIEDAKNAKNYRPTIVIREDPYAATRGHSILGREFILHNPYPVRDTGILMDGTRIEDEYYVVTKEEYIKRVPEQKDIAGDFVYIPVMFARISLYPRDLTL